jgi:hypothetical protein
VVGFTTGSGEEVPGKKENLLQENIIIIITPRSRVLEKFTVAQTSKKFSAFHYSLLGHTAVQFRRSRPTFQKCIVSVIAAAKIQNLTTFITVLTQALNYNVNDDKLMGIFNSLKQKIV